MRWLEFVFQPGKALGLGAVAEDPAYQPVLSPGAPMAAIVAEDFEHGRALRADPGLANR